MSDAVMEVTRHAFVKNCYRVCGKAATGYSVMSGAPEACLCTPGAVWKSKHIHRSRSETIQDIV